MKYQVLAPLLAAALVSGCATITTPRNCERALTGLTAAQQIIAVLQAAGVKPEIAAKIASALAVGQVTVATACAGVG